MEATGQEFRRQMSLSLAFHIYYQKCLLIQAGRACLESQPSVDPSELEANQFTHGVPGHPEIHNRDLISEEKKQVKCLSTEGIAWQQSIDSSPPKKTLGIFSGEFYSPEYAPKYSVSLI